MAGTGRRVFKILGWIALITLLIAIGLDLVGWFKAQSYINKNLSEWVAEKSGNLYELNFSRIQLEIAPLSVSVSDVDFHPNENTINEKPEIPAEKVMYSFKSPEIKINSIGLRQLIKNNYFICKEIQVKRPEFELSGSNFIQEDTIQNFNRFFVELRPLFKNYIKKIEVGEITFIDANYGLYNSPDDAIQISKARNFSLVINKFSTDSSLIFSDERFFESDDILISINSFNHSLGDSLHAISIDTLEYSLKTSDIRAAGFQLNHKMNNTEKNLYEVYVPHFYMKSKSVTRFAITDSIDVDFLEFQKPVIKFFQKENPNRLEIEDINNFDLYTLIENQFSKIEIDSFYLTDANLEIYRQPKSDIYQQKFGAIDVKLYGFALDSLSSLNTEKLFHADDFSMDVSDYHLHLEDNQHDFRADSMFVSTLSNSLGVKNIGIFPTDSVKKASRTAVKVDCSALEIENVNLKNLYHTRTLPTKSIVVTQPKVEISYHTELRRSRNRQETGILFEMVTAYLKGVYSEVVAIDYGKLNIRNFRYGILQGYFETDFSFALSAFSLDSTSIEQTDKFFYATDFDLHFNNYQMKLVDNLHKITVEQVSLQSSDRKVQIENLRLQPVISEVTDEVMQQFNRSELYDIKVPRIDLRGIDLKNAFFNNRLRINKFQISNPEIYFENFGALREMQDNKEFSEFYQLIFNYISDFNIADITVPSGKFTWVNHTKKGRTTSFDNEFSASLENFILNEEELNKKRLLFSDHFEISVKDQLFQLSDSVHNLRAGEINLSSKRKSIGIENALLYPVITSEKYKTLPTTFQVSIPALQINNFDFLNAYYSRELTLSGLELNAPRFQVYSRSDLTKSLDLSKYQFPLPMFIRSLNLQELKVVNGEVITYETRGLDQHARSNFKIDLLLPNVAVKNNEQGNAQFSSDNLQIKISDFKTPLGKLHEIEVGELTFNRKQKNISFSELKIIPFGEKGKGNRFNIYAPKLEFVNFDLEKALKKNSFYFDRIGILNPEINIEINDSVQGDKFEFAKKLDLYPLVEPYVNEINVNKLELENVDLQFNWFEKQLIDRQIQLVFNDINIGENQPPGNLLNSKEFELSTANLKTKSENGWYEFSVDSLLYNSSKHNLLFKNLAVIPLLKTEEFPRQTGFQTDVVKGQTQFVELQGVNESLWLNQNIVQAEKLLLGKTNLSIYRNKRFPFNHEQRPPWPQDLIKNIKQPFRIDSVILAPSEIMYSELMDISDEPATLGFYGLQFKAGKLSNQESVLKQHPGFIIHASTKLFGRYPLVAEFSFDLTSSDYSHTVTGSLGKLPLTALNPMVEKAAPIAIESGQLNQFDFSFSADNKIAGGELYFGYDEFKISVLEMDSDGTKRSKLASFWANKMMLNSKNPKGDKLEPTSLLYERDIERSILNYWWKTIFTGSKITLGIEDEEKK